MSVDVDRIWESNGVVDSGVALLGALDRTRLESWFATRVLQAKDDARASRALTDLSGLVAKIPTELVLPDRRCIRATVQVAVQHLHRVFGHVFADQDSISRIGRGHVGRRAPVTAPLLLFADPAAVEFAVASETRLESTRLELFRGGLGLGAETPDLPLDLRLEFLRREIHGAREVALELTTEALDFDFGLLDLSGELLHEKGARGNRDPLAVGVSSYCTRWPTGRTTKCAWPPRTGKFEIPRAAAHELSGSRGLLGSHRRRHELHPTKRVTSREGSTDTQGADLRRLLPSVDRLLQVADELGLMEVYGRERVLVHARALLEAWRAREDLSEARIEAIGEHLALDLGRLDQLRVRRVINATGIFLHTNLGRAPLPSAVVARLPALGDAAVDVEFDLELGRRGDRNRRIDAQLREITGCESALATNNNAAALVLALGALVEEDRARRPGAEGPGEVIVSRGELVEIGGSFRIPDILRLAGVSLKEVGTTNRTRIEDVREGLSERTIGVLKVYSSNYRIVGFTESVSPQELVAFGREAGVPVLVDEGSGLLVPSTHEPLRDHPSLTELLGFGCDLVCGSADKVLGGPQAGLLLGRERWIHRCRRHPLYRAVRPGRLIVSALSEVLDRHLRARPIPLDDLFVDPDEHRQRLERACARWAELGSGPPLEIVAADAFVGGGSAPERPVPGEALALPVDAGVQRSLRGGEPAVVGRMLDGALVLDLRSVAPADDELLLEALRVALDEGHAGPRTAAAEAE